MRFTLASAANPGRPKGVSLSALALGVLAVAAARTLAAQFPAQGRLGLCYGGLGLALAFYILWSYWKGSPWARVLLLIASFVVAAEGISNIFEREANLIGLMSQPLLFFRFALAAFLLYWLNSRPLRAWFQNASTAADLVGQHLEGRLCTSVASSGAPPNQQWHLAFEHDAELTLNCPWRIVLDDNLAFASNSSIDPVAGAPADEPQPWQLVQNLRVKSVRIAPRTSDLFLAFEMGIELQSWSSPWAQHDAQHDAQHSAQHDAPHSAQQWRFSDPTLTVVADSARASVQPRSTSNPCE